MGIDIKELAIKAEEAERLLIGSAIQHHKEIGMVGLGTGELLKDGDIPAIKAAINFLQSVKRHASVGDVPPEIEGDLVAMLHTFETLPPKEREPAFKCVASHKACLNEASSLAERVLCGIALTICLAKEVVPLA